MRRGARKLALDILYEHEVTDRPISEVSERYAANPAFEYAHQIAVGVSAHGQQIDALIIEHAKDWDLERMPIIDRTLLRIGIYEMQCEDEVPPAVAINEAVEIAKIYSTEESGKFINGILGAVAKAGHSR